MNVASFRGRILRGLNRHSSLVKPGGPACFRHQDGWNFRNRAVPSGGLK
jgi:hypothetical protein